MEKKIYISGPIDSQICEGESHSDKINRFAVAEAFLKGRTSCDVVNPMTIGAELDHQALMEDKPTPRICDFMRADLKALCDCDAIYLLKGWEYSSGCRVEWNCAVAMRLDLFIQSDEEISEGKKFLAKTEALHRKEIHDDLMKT